MQQCSKYYLACCIEASHSSVFKMTVKLISYCVCTVYKSVFISCTGNVVKMNGPLSSAEETKRERHSHWRERVGEWVGE